MAQKTIADNCTYSYPLRYAQYRMRYAPIDRARPVTLLWIATEIRHGAVLSRDCERGAALDEFPRSQEHLLRSKIFIFRWAPVGLCRT